MACTGVCGVYVCDVCMFYVYAVCSACVIHTVKFHLLTEDLVLHFFNSV